MRELIGRLDVADDATAGALRVIDHFDGLVEERATLAAVVRAVAALAGCPAGLHDAGRGITRRHDPTGHPLPETQSRSWAQTAVPGRPGSWIWLERTGEARPLDALVLERAAKAIHTLTGHSADRSADAAVRIACDPDASASDRSDAAKRLGLTGPVTVIASPGPLPPHSTRIGRHMVALVRGTPDLPPDLRAGTAIAQDPAHLPTTLEQARLALRLTDRANGPGPSQLAYDDLGALAVLAERTTPQEAAAITDVLHLDHIRATRPWVIDTLQAVLDHASLRQAATGLHLHHSTLQERLAWLAARLGYTVTKPGGRQRTAVAIAYWRIAHSETNWSTTTAEKGQ
ncbi:helix-turn-helix domain-containing protein [Streptomyces sp. NBC_00582]|uniref:helix-turn-helix domain-containing protein n=1 Tax=Streptomyces sp. NBC_00582 TaxID=2975783 RepID=UPI002E818048|nr:helix-turn-helix domain-containing protein [Streptomyces sp. NBC_00582]WUB61676.1 helix-turn-helix domain-containing protein [Streptomyces sp. NBC_00582]